MRRSPCEFLVSRFVISFLYHHITLTDIPWPRSTLTLDSQVLQQRQPADKHNQPTLSLYRLQYTPASSPCNGCAKIRGHRADRRGDERNSGARRGFALCCWDMHSLEQGSMPHSRWGKFMYLQKIESPWTAKICSSVNATNCVSCFALI